MSDRSEIRAALNAIKSGDSAVRQFGTAILRRYMAKVLAKYGDISEFTTKDPSIEISAEERSDVRTCMAILATFQRADLLALTNLKAEITCELGGFFAAPVVDEPPESIDSPEWKTIESTYIDQIERCETPAELDVVKSLYERAKAAQTPDIPGKELRVYGGASAPKT